MVSAFLTRPKLLELSLLYLLYFVVVFFFLFTETADFLPYGT